MLTNKIKTGVRKNKPLAPKRRQLIHAGLTGAVVAMVATATPCFAAAPVLTHNFGPNYTVRDVYQFGSYTHVELGFQVNGQSFSTHLRSADGKVWRPV
jgi:hypothetical protein